MNGESQNEVDYLWTALSEGGEEGPCGWLKDRYGLSWQIMPVRLTELLNDPDEAAAQRVMAAMLTSPSSSGRTRRAPSGSARSLHRAPAAARWLVAPRLPIHGNQPEGTRSVADHTAYQP